MRIILFTIISYLNINIAYPSSLEDKYVDTSLRIIAEALTDSTAYNRLAFLCDKFGPRLSGSPNLENAINWIIKEMDAWCKLSIAIIYFIKSPTRMSGAFFCPCESKVRRVIDFPYLQLFG